MGFARITQIDASPRPKVAQFLRSCLNAGGGPSGPAENGTNVLRTPKYNKRQGKVKHNFYRNFPYRITIPVRSQRFEPLGGAALHDSTLLLGGAAVHRCETTATMTLGFSR